MPISVIGVNFKTAPVEVREQLTFGEERIPRALAELKRLPVIEEAVIVSTCHRTEVYAVGQNLPRRDHPLIAFLTGFFAIGEEQCLPYLYRYHEERAVRHLFNVASGIDSMILGEAQILGQVKEALSLAERHGTAGSIVNRLFRAGIEVGKLGRRESALGANSGSVSHAAVLLAKRIFETLEGHTAIVIGAGETGRLTAKALRKEGLSEIWVANRHPERARDLARELEGTPIPFEELEAFLWKADIIMSATSAPHYIVEADMVAQAITRRRHAPLFLVDLAMPRDIDPRVNQIENVYLYDLDDLEDTVSQEHREREEAVAKVKGFIEEELADFFSWYHSRGAVPVIRALKDQVEGIRREEFSKFLKQCPHLSGSERAALEAMTRGIVNKVVHHPLIQLKEYATDPDGWKYLETVKDLFALTPVHVEAPDPHG